MIIPMSKIPKISLWRRVKEFKLDILVLVLYSLLVWYSLSEGYVILAVGLSGAIGYTIRIIMEKLKW